MSFTIISVISGTSHLIPCKDEPQIFVVAHIILLNILFMGIAMFATIAKAYICISS